MAHVYIYSGAVGTGTGASWANAYTTAGAAAAAKAAGDNFWVAHDHAETAASAKTINSPGTAVSPCTFICVNRAGTVPPVSADLRTTATITTTGASDIFLNGYAYYYGITFSIGSGANDAVMRFGWDGAAFSVRLQSCLLSFARTNGTVQAVRVGSGAQPQEQALTLDNTPISFGSTDDGIRTDAGKFLWINTASALPGSVPNNLLYNTNGDIVLRGVDLSAMGVGKSLLYACFDGTCTFHACKLGSSVTVPPASTASLAGGAVYIVGSDSAATNYRNEKYAFHGSQVPETTIVRTGGATDGTTPISTKIVTTANSTWLNPYVSLPITTWNDTTAANVTVSGIWGGGAVPNNDDIWIEVSYMGSSLSPIATTNTANGKADFLATNAAQSTDASAWGGSTTAFKMSVTLSSPQPAMKGLIYVAVKVAVPSTTLYIDPKVVLS